MSLTADIRKLTLLQKREEILKRRAREASKKRERQEQIVHDGLIDEGYDPATNDGVKVGGVHYSPQATDYHVIQDRAKLIEHLREKDSGLIEERLREGELNKMVRRLLDNKEQFPPGLGYHTKTFVSTRGLNALIDKEQEDRKSGK